MCRLLPIVHDKILKLIDLIGSYRKSTWSDCSVQIGELIYSNFTFYGSLEISELCYTCTYKQPTLTSQLTTRFVNINSFCGTSYHKNFAPYAWQPVIVKLYSTSSPTNAAVNTLITE